MKEKVTKITNSDIFNLHMSLLELKVAKPEFSIDAHIAINKTRRALEPIHEAIQLKREEIGTKYAQLDEDGNPKTMEGNNGQPTILIDNDKNPQFLEELNELMSNEQEVTLVTIPRSELNTTQKLKAPQHFEYFCEYLIEE